MWMRRSDPDGKGPHHVTLSQLWRNELAPGDHVLLCRTVAAAQTVWEGGKYWIQTSVTDPSGRIVKSEKFLWGPLILHVQSGSFDSRNFLNSVLKGTIRVLKGVTWAPVTNDQSFPSFWTGEDRLLFDKLRGIGNKTFTANRLSDALRFYQLALQYASDDKEASLTLSNKAAALFKLGCNNAAYKSAKQALELDADNRKAAYRKAQALIGMTHFEEALTELTEVLKKGAVSQDSGDFESLRDKTKGYLAGKGSSTLVQNLFNSLYKKAAVDKRLHDFQTKDVQEFTGFVELRSRGEGKMKEGRLFGMFATQDIPPGQLLFVNRAIGVRPISLDGSGGRDNPGPKSLLNHLISLIQFDSSMGAPLYQLYAGKEEGGPSPAHHQMEEDESAGVCLERLEGILKNNAIIDRGHHFVVQDPGVQIGLWWATSFIRHSCSDSNCHVDYFNDLVFVKATEHIGKGEEVLSRSNVPDGVPLEERKAFLEEGRGVFCFCRLCLWENAGKGSDLVLRRNKINKSLQSIVMRGPGELERLGEARIHDLLSDIHFLQGLWAELRMGGLVDAASLFSLATCFHSLIRLKDWAKKHSWLKALVSMMELVTAVEPLGFKRMVEMSTLSHFYRDAGRMEKVRELGTRLEEDAKVWFGSSGGIAVFKACHATLGG